MVMAHPIHSDTNVKENKNTQRLYDDLAWLWPIWGSAEEYADYCEQVAQLIFEHTQIPVNTLLNLGCGGGKNIFNLKRYYDVTGLDLSPQMLTLAQELNPESEFVQGDMRTFTLQRMFDAVLVDDAVSYMLSKTDLRAVFVSAWQHLSPGGVLVVSPDVTKETFVQNNTVETLAVGKGKLAHVEVTFIENSYDPNPNDEHFEGTMVYLIREDGKLRIETDHHTFGLFSLDVWREILAEVGFKVHEKAYVDNDKEYVTFVCFKPI